MPTTTVILNIAESALPGLGCNVPCLVSITWFGWDDIAIYLVAVPPPHICRVDLIEL